MDDIAKCWSSISFANANDNTETHICAIFMIIELLDNESELVKVDKGMKWNSS